MLESLVRPAVNRFPRTAQVVVHQGIVWVGSALIDRYLFQGESNAAPLVLRGGAILAAGTVIKDLQNPHNNDVTLVMVLAPLVNVIAALFLMISTCLTKGFEYLVVTATPALLGMVTSGLFSDGSELEKTE